MKKDKKIKNMKKKIKKLKKKIRRLENVSYYSPRFHIKGCTTWDPY